jgi:geranylgeranyl pyrophosphate synthase
VPIALNAANLLYFLPLSLLDESSLGPDRKLCLHQRYTAAVVRCHHGQALDLCGRLGDLAQHEVKDAVEAATQLKTGALTELAIVLGAVAAGASADRERALARFGREIGVGLQMLDDLGGITSQRRRAKGHEDLVGGRLTWTWAWLAESLDAASWCELRALGDRVERYGTHPETLAQTMRPLLGARPKRAIHARLRGAVDTLRAEVGPSRATRALESEIELLESSYE